MLAFLAFAAAGFATVAPPPSPAPAAEEETAEAAEIVSLSDYNVKADRIEDFGFRVEIGTFSNRRPNLATLWFSTFLPTVTAVVPNTAADKAGLQPGDRILKSDGAPTVGGLFSTGKFGNWDKRQKQKWAEVAAGEKRVTWTLEVESPVTKAVRAVTLVIPTPPPRWGSSVWRPPAGRPPATVPEAGPLAEHARTVLDQGIWIWLDPFYRETAFGQPVKPGDHVTGYEWRLGGGEEARRYFRVTRCRGRTDILLSVFWHGGNRNYLTSPSGQLEKAWHWHRGKAVVVPPDEARATFEHEVDLWAKKVGKVSARWPLELKPGYDPDAFLATLNSKDRPKPLAPRPLAAEFLKLPPATEAERTLFTDANAKLGADHDRWAYTETSHSVEDRRVLVTRFDPSQTGTDRCVLRSIDGESPTAAQEQEWRATGGDVPRPLGDLPPLASLVDLKDLRVAAEEGGATVFELPMRGGNAEFPAEKFQARFRVSHASRGFEEISVVLRDSFRLAGVVKVTEAGLHARFAALDPALAPQPVLLKGGGAARIVLIKVSRDFENTRTDFKRVEPQGESGAGD